MKNFKTSERLSIKFTIFTTIILALFWLTVNIFSFYSWYNLEKIEIINLVDKEYEEIFISHKETFDTWSSINLREKFTDEILDKWGFIEYVEDKSSKPNLFNRFNDNDFWLVKRGEKHYLFYNKYLDRIWNIKAYYDITPFFQNQVLLFRISFLLFILFWIFSYYISIYFTRSSLAQLNKIAKFVKNVDFDDLNKTIDVFWPNDDEIKIVAEAFNKAIKKINLKALKLKEFSSDVAHEFKTPLMSINTEIDYALKSRKYKESFINIKDQIKNLDSLISSLLSLTRLEWNNLNLKEENLWELILSVFSQVESIYRYKNLSTVIDLKDNVFKKIDRNLFETVVKNLISNAFKYTLSWSINIYLDENIFMVSDTWIGISPNNIANIWDRFYKEDESRWDYQSHGLGLSLVKEILNKHNFKISVESEVDKWTKFTIYL